MMDYSFEKLKEYQAKPIEEVQALSMIDEPYAQAYMWMRAYAENLNQQINGYYEEQAEWEYKDDNSIRKHSHQSFIDLDELINIGTSHLGSDWGDYISYGGTFEGVCTPEIFWDKLGILLEIEIPNDKRTGIFSCSC